MLRPGAKEQVASFPFDFNLDEAMKMYKYGMQARFGDCKSEKPAWYDVMGKNKYNAWMSVKGMDKKKA